ncbi:hypothetical protein E2C01_009417 [Portunus trituberculatus]|uniref:Uncharacterized protein n=1 Tax=Portunus trituberculatus TaxID=210409 RepID=A0A5B7D4G0_PORTR|nr:hypothetical protein [Portunus trituberculatus]
MAFKKTGLYPPDCSVYPVKTFNPDLYKLCKSVQTSSEPIHKPATPKKVNPPREMISPSTSFEQVMADVFRNPYPTTSGKTQTIARRKIDVHSCVIMHDEFLEAVEEKEKMILEKKKKAEEKQRNRTTRKRKEVSSREDVDEFLEEFEEKTVEKNRKAPEERTSRKRFRNNTPLKEPSSTEEEDAELLNSSHSSISSTYRGHGRR